MAQMNTEDFFKQGIEKARRKDYQEAIEDYNQALRLKPDCVELDPNDAEAYSYRGNTRYLLKDYSGALADFNKTLQLNSNNSDVYNIID